MIPTQTIVPILQKNFNDLHRHVLDDEVQSKQQILDTQHRLDSLRIKFLKEFMTTTDAKLLVAEELRPLTIKIAQLEGEINNVHNSSDSALIQMMLTDIQELQRKVSSIPGDDAKKGEEYLDDRASTDLPAELAQAFAKSKSLVLHTAHAPSVSGEYSRKMPREESSSRVPEPKAKKALNLGDNAPHPPPTLSLQEEQRMRHYVQEGLLVSYLDRFEGKDLWVPADLNDWWEKLKECYTKWIVFANLNRSPDVQREAWRYFLVNWVERGMIERIQAAQKKSKDTNDSLSTEEDCLPSKSQE
ncbi:uncharacterized protein LOC130997656 [Salvia miltiorrhiza]|uniref:uncharacterized protein LOC130997656 n=1 Tax=Salvia miltiorrhiza TaxID=226208 RepID=UPI0025AC7A8A|nr:uncharacterized protein LOC130997656 [Salvia miltiorrhiza]XP_057779038.1 uncharacterized protein LOC130997656 [Salvia miltiorrhiza]